ncbi:hypothetical protein BV22DRAFT_1198074 [Leucogyrophana mollusca]|uniref:Uncharacterized protein n=1 Tax=Leucogyrophana mollusca TaxID=85980 RepID=A0ACB8BA32_9AGAM|nr:hypothetical protein BV22DRAFT_1198074 [Leucogyrophana mollusca]
MGRIRADLYVNTDAITEEKGYRWSKLPHVRRHGVFNIPSKGLLTFLWTFVREIHEGMMASEVDMEQLELDRFSMSSTSRNSLSSLLHSTHHRISRLYNTAEMMYSSDSSCGSLYQPKSYHTCKASE